MSLALKEDENFVSRMYIRANGEPAV